MVFIKLFVCCFTENVIVTPPSRTIVQELKGSPPTKKHLSRKSGAHEQGLKSSPITNRVSRQGKWPLNIFFPNVESKTKVKGARSFKTHFMDVISFLKAFEANNYENAKKTTIPIFWFPTKDDDEKKNVLDFAWMLYIYYI